MGSRPDHRCRMVPAPHPSILDLLGAGPRPPIPRSIGAPAIPRPSLAGTIVFCALLILPAIFGIRLMVNGFILGPLLLFIITAVMFCRTLYVSLPRLDWELWSTHILNAGHCPSCGYIVLGLAPEEDGCIVCPECSAAWFVGKVGSGGGAGARAADRADQQSSNAAEQRLSSALPFSPPSLPQCSRYPL